MYQIEVKRWLVFHKFPVGDRWDVTIDIDAMERGEKGQHPTDKQAIAAECEKWLRSQGVKIVPHPLYGRAVWLPTKKVLAHLWLRWRAIQPVRRSRPCTRPSDKSSSPCATPRLKSPMPSRCLMRTSGPCSSARCRVGSRNCFAYNCGWFQSQAFAALRSSA